MNFKTNNSFSIKISICENMSKDRVIILCNPELKEAIENILIIAQDTLDEDLGDNLNEKDI